MNTDAASLVLEGKLPQAIKFFYSCLDLATELDSSGYLRKNVDFVSVDEETFLSPISLDEVMNTQDPSDNMSPDNCFIFFRNIFVLEGLDEIKSQTNLMSFALTVLFNLAVVHQELGLGTGDLACLSESLRLYQIMIDLFSRVSPDAPVSLLEMSLYNNLGHLLAFFLDKDGVLEMRARLCNRLERSARQPDQWGFKNFFRSSLTMCCEMEMDTDIAPAA